jgi:hypothetical protein
LRWNAPPCPEPAILLYFSGVLTYSQVFEEVKDFPISMEEATRLRDEFIEERKKYAKESMHPFQDFKYSFCEQ